MDVLVIGGGVGGLVAAARLAIAGHGVTLVETAPTVGGKLAQVSLGGRPIDVGPTVFTLPDVFDAVFREAGERLADHLTLTRCDRLARHVWPDGSRLDLHDDPQRSREAIAAFAGARAGGEFEAFQRRAKETYDTLAPIFMRAQRPAGPLALAGRAGPKHLGALMRIGALETLWSSLSKRFSDPRLAQLFGRYATYNGSSPFLAPATLMLISEAEARGVFTIEGGMIRLAEALADLARRHGADIRTGVGAERIETDQAGRATGARLTDGERLRADATVFAGDANALAQGRLGPAVRRACSRPLPVAERSLSAFTIAAVAPVPDDALLRHTVFFSADYSAEFERIGGARRLPDDPTVYVCAQDRDASGRRVGAGPERLFFIVNAPPDGDGRALSTEEIERCQTAVLSRLARSGCPVALDAAATCLSTPSDFEARFPGTGGALYGRASHGWTASFRRPGARTPMPGLYLCGGSAHPGAGLPMAALSGTLAVEAILSDRASTSRSHPAAMPGGMSTRSRRTGATA